MKVLVKILYQIPADIITAKSVHIINDCMFNIKYPIRICKAIGVGLVKHYCKYNIIIIWGLGITVSFADAQSWQDRNMVNMNNIEGES